MQLTSAPDQTTWFTALEPRQQELVKQSRTLLKQAERDQFIVPPHNDYGYVIFPLAKAYEGFLKRYFFEVGLITETVYKSHRFRIGRALNPDVRFEHRNGEWLFDDLERECGRGMARQLWDAWLTCRNQVFHYFPDRDNRISLDTATKYLLLLEDAMAAAVTCQVQSRADLQPR